MSEVQRFQCEVRHVLRLRHDTGSSPEVYFGLVAAKRPKEAVEALRSAAVAQWALGNRGKPGDWR